MRHLQAVRKRLRQHGEVVVLTRDLHLAGLQVLHRMVAAVMSELEPSRLRPARQRQQLMPQAYPHDGDCPRQAVVYLAQDAAP